MKKMLLLALVALVGVSVDVSAGSPFLYNFNVTNNNATKTIALRFGGKNNYGLARILKPGETKAFYPSCAFIISIANIDENTPGSVIDAINKVDSLLDAVLVSFGSDTFTFSSASTAMYSYKKNAAYTSAINSLTFNFIPVDNEPTDPNVCNVNDTFNLTVSEVGDTYKISFESASSSANLKDLSTPATSLTNVSGTESAS